MATTVSTQRGPVSAAGRTAAFALGAPEETPLSIVGWAAAARRGPFHPACCRAARLSPLLPCSPSAGESRANASAAAPRAEASCALGSPPGREPRRRAAERPSSACEPPAGSCAARHPENGASQTEA